MLIDCSDTYKIKVVLDEAIIIGSMPEANMAQKLYHINKLL